jgi:hypothetical protein
MRLDCEDLGYGESPDERDDDDDDDDDEIMTELRQIRREMLVEFPTPEALLRAMKAHEAEEARQGRPVVSLPLRRLEDNRRGVG